jgi:hypothetical protein
MSILHKDVYHGGVSQRNSEISSWEAVYNMIRLPGATLSKISYSSLTGFIFRLDIPKDKKNVEFYGLNDDKTALTKPIYSIVFKLAIISDYDDHDKLNPLFITAENQSFKKETENLESFRKEANTQQQIYIDTLSPNGNPITLSIIDFSYFDKRSTAVLLTELNTKHKSRTVSEMLRYIGLNIQNEQNEQNEQHRLKNRRLGMITMELAEPTYRELADLPIGEDTYNNGCKYAIAQTLILFLKSKKLNFDSHAGNVLASTDPNTPGTVLIDFGRVLDFKNDIFEQIKIYYNQLTGHNYDVDFDKYKSQDVTYLYESQNNPIETVVTKMANIIQFLSYMDYIMNSINFDMKGPYDRPQLIRLLQYLYGPSFRTNWGWNNNRNYVSPDWKLTQEIIDRYTAIIPIIQSLTEAPTNQKSYVSKAAINSRVRAGVIATFNKESINEYDRSNTIQSSMTPVSPEVMERSGRTSSDNKKDNKSFFEQCWGKFCDKKKKEGGRKTYRKNKRRFVHKKIITRQKKSNKQRRSSKNKRRFVHKKINTRRKKSNKQRRTSKQKRK